ncbi:MAG TPA: two-component system response regulator [Desulfotomaculum sp.]|nr:two-component system response regulator [Desulfotomaculum sp.]HBY03095.1 two-component system response regulator [Desulfotomaculum sp.]
MAEDDDVDAMAIQRGFREAKILNEFVRAKDGIEALEIMRGQNGHKTIAPPYVVLLDLNMPRMDGFAFLDELRQDEKLQQMVVFVLTTSKDDEDRMRAYSKCIAGYIVKSEAGKGFANLIAMLDYYWRIVILP